MNETRIELQYPRDKSSAKFAIVGLVDVRAADDIRISYDFDRDGWKIEQSSVFEWEIDDEICDRCWHEVAFVGAWRGIENAESETPETPEI